VFVQAQRRKRTQVYKANSNSTRRTASNDKQTVRKTSTCLTYKSDGHLRVALITVYRHCVLQCTAKDTSRHDVNALCEYYNSKYVYNSEYAPRVHTVKYMVVGRSHCIYIYLYICFKSSIRPSIWARQSMHGDKPLVYSRANYGEAVGPILIL